MTGLLTFIAILVILLVIVIFWAINSFAYTHAGHFTIIAQWGAKPINILGPGLKYIGSCGWPYLQKHSVIQIERIQKNIPVLVTCSVSNRAFDSDNLKTAQTSGSRVSITDCHTDDLSLNFELDFCQTNTKIFDPEKIENYFRYINTEGHDPLEKICEELVDIVQNKIRDATRDLDILDVMRLDPDILGKIQQEIIDEIEKNKLFIAKFSLKLNEPFRPVDSDIVEALESIAKGEFLSSQEKIQLARERRIAEQSVEILNLRAKGEAQRFVELAKVLGIDDLSKENQAQYWQTREALEIQKALASSTNAKFVISSDLLAEAKRLASSFTKQGK